MYKIKFTPYFEAMDIYDVTKPAQRYIPLQGFNENAVYYDIVKRNQIMKDRNSSSEDDDDDDLFDF